MPADAYSLEQFAEDASRICEEYYSARQPDIGARMSRFHLAIEIFLSDLNLNGDDIADQVLEDSGDQGVDFFWVTDDDEPRVFAVQIKDHLSFSKQPQLEAVGKLTDEIKFLLSRQRVDNSWDERRKERYADLREAKSKEYTVHYALIMTGGPKPLVTTSDFADDKFEEGVESLEVLGVDQLVSLQIENLAPQSPDVAFELPEGHWFNVIDDASKRAVVLYVPADKYVEATRPHKARIFRLNPRLYLGKANRSNKKMLETLRDKTQRAHFHLFNNGVTAVCKTISVEELMLKADDFQVVNGCQTTETLWKASAEPDTDLSDVLVPLRVIETGEDAVLANKISETTNSQTAISSADLVANSLRQREIKEALESANPPFFYEARRGSWAQERPVERERFRVAPGQWSDRPVKSVRHIKLKELAQALLAVCANPNAAKEQISTLFSSTGQDSQYARIVENSWTDGVQLQLVVELFKYVSSRDHWIKENFPTEEEKAVFASLAKLGRFYITYLIYKQWRSESGEPFDPALDSPTLLSPASSRAILENFREKVQRLPNLAVRALLTVKGEKSLETRALLRQSAHRSDIESKFSAFMAALEAIDE